MAVERGRRLSIRARLTFTYTSLLVASTLIVLAGVWVMLAIIPGYEFTYGPYPSAFWPVVYVQGKGDVLRLFAIASVPIVLVVGILGGLVSYLVAGRVLKPLTDLTTLVRTIDERSLNTRLDLRGPADEIGTLAATFDTMLSRLETSFATNARFAANAAHELGTPLATTKTILHVARRQAANDPLAADTLARLAAVNEQMISITAALLALTSTAQSPLNDVVDLAELVDAALSDNHADIERRRLTVRVSIPGQAGSDSSGMGLASGVGSGAIRVAGDRVLLARAIVNLVRNAVLHNVDGGYLETSVANGVAAASGAPAAVLTVSNGGADLAGVDLESLTEPFVRAEQRLRRGASRTDGHGLGLALVRSIADVHSAELRLERNEPDGLRVTLTLPRL